MPTYTYECEKCRKRFEVVQKMTDESFKEHRDCIKEWIPGVLDTFCNGKVRRIITGCNFILKGTGWNKSRTKSQKKVDEALRQAGIPDESGGYEVGE